MKSENDKKLTKIEKKTNGRKIDRTELLRTVDRKLAVPDLDAEAKRKCEKYADIMFTSTSFINCNDFIILLF